MTREQIDLIKSVHIRADGASYCEGCFGNGDYAQWPCYTLELAVEAECHVDRLEEISSKLPRFNRAHRTITDAGELDRWK